MLIDAFISGIPPQSQELPQKVKKKENNVKENEPWVKAKTFFRKVETW